MASSYWKSEAQFQSYCYKWYDREYPQLRGRLFMIYNNPPNAIVGGMLVSMGLRKGVSDLLFLPIPRTIVWIELKIGNKPQTDDQKEFEKLVSDMGWKYYLVREEIEKFKQLIDNIIINPKEYT